MYLASYISESKNETKHYRSNFFQTNSSLFALRKKKKCITLIYKSISWMISNYFLVFFCFWHSITHDLLSEKIIETLYFHTRINVMKRFPQTDFQIVFFSKVSPSKKSWSNTNNIYLWYYLVIKKWFILRTLAFKLKYILKFYRKINFLWIDLIFRYVWIWNKQNIYTL